MWANDTALRSPYFDKTCHEQISIIIEAVAACKAEFFYVEHAHIGTLDD